MRQPETLSIIYGIEPYVILKDIWGLSDREIERIALWMADALVEATLRDAARQPARRAAEPARAARRPAP